MMRAARLTIWRGTSREDGGFEDFDISFEDGESVLDGLVALRRDRAPDLAAGSPVSTPMCARNAPC